MHSLFRYQNINSARRFEDYCYEIEEYDQEHDKWSTVGKID